jgi:hypothetical protein
MVIIAFSYAVYKAYKLDILQYKFKKYPTLLVGQYLYRVSTSYSVSMGMILKVIIC